MIDNWVILGPGRTGSKVIAEFIWAHTPWHNIISPDSGPHTMLAKNRVYHSHSISLLDARNDNTLVIISTRDMVDSTLSWCIQPKLGYFHWYPTSDLRRPNELPSTQNIPTAFYLSPAEFELRYNSTVMFYQQLVAYGLHNVNHIIIDYEEYSEDPLQLQGMFQLPKLSTKFRFPAKDAGSPEDVILNWNEIEAVANTLQRQPMNILGSK